MLKTYSGQIQDTFNQKTPASQAIVEYVDDDAHHHLTLSDINNVLENSENPDYSHFSEVPIRLLAFSLYCIQAAFHQHRSGFLADAESQKLNVIEREKIRANHALYPLLLKGLTDRALRNLKNLNLKGLHHEVPEYIATEFVHTLMNDRHEMILDPEELVIYQHAQVVFDPRNE